MQYGALLSRAWNIIWRNKIIWVFGFLAALGSGGGPNFNFRSSFSQGGPSTGDLPPELQRQFVRLLSDQTLLIVIVIALLLVGLVIGLVVAFVSALGHGAMVDMVREADETERTSFSAGWRAGARRMFPIFLIRFLLGLPIFIIVMAGLVPFLVSFVPLLTGTGLRGSEGLFAGGIMTSIFLCFCPALCMGLLLTIPLHVLERLAIRALVLEDLGVWGSIRRGWTILTSNLGDIVVLWLIFLLIGIGFAIVIGLPLAIVLVAVLFPLLLLAATSLIFIVPLLLVVILFWLVGAVFNSVLETYASTVWTLAYRQFVGRAVPVVMAS